MELYIFIFNSSIFKVTCKIPAKNKKEAIEKTFKSISESIAIPKFLKEQITKEIIKNKILKGGE